MMRSLFAAVSGLRNHQLSLSVIGNNISNINTIGFKTGRALFQEMLSQTVRGATAPGENAGGTNPMQIGLGMSVASVASAFGQGQLQTTGNMLDMAIQGDGFFVSRGGEREYYSRAGAFTFDGEGRLTTGTGLLVQGWLADADGVITSGAALGDITLPFGQKSPAQATTSLRLSSNLDAAAEALGTITETNSLRAIAQAGDSLETLFDSSGQGLGVQSGDVVEITYAGTAMTALSNLTDADANPLDLQAGDVITVNDGVDTDTFTYNAGMTLGQFAAQVEAALQDTEPDVTVSLNNDGSLLFSNPSGGAGNDLTVTISAPGRTTFNQLAVSIPVIDGTSTARTGATQVREQLVSGTHFTNVSELAAVVEDALNLGSSGASVVFQGGRFLYDNSVGSHNLVDVQLTRSGEAGLFAEAMGLRGEDLIVGATMQSDLLLDTATVTDNLVDLYSSQGEYLDLTTGDILSFNGRLGGEPVSEVTMTVTNTGDGSGEDQQVQSLGGLIDELESILDLSPAGSVELDNGSIVINGRSGLTNELTDIQLAEANNPALASAMFFAETQAASDVTHEASIRVFDAQGNDFLLTMIFTKDNDSPNRWNWQTSLEEGEILSGGAGAVTFNGDGSLNSFTTDDGVPLRIDPASGAEGPLEIDFDAGTRGGLDGVTGFATASTTAIVDQDGYGMGTLESISVDNSGVIRGVFTNGNSRSLAQLALARFNNPGGLQREGGDGWISTANSGEGVIRVPGLNSDVGSISPGTLEMSNVDIAQEFTSMIIAQRGFQANARTITTSDEMLMELVNLKR